MSCPKWQGSIDIPMNVMEWIAGEVLRQEPVSMENSGPLETVWMAKAWMYLKYGIEGFDALVISISEVRYLAYLIDYRNNPEGRFRGVPVGTNSVMGGFHRYPEVGEVKELMFRWYQHLGNMTCDEAYKQLMEIHPWEDGNGRVGALLYNLFNRSLDNPVAPPDFWSKEYLESLEKTK